MAEYTPSVSLLQASVDLEYESEFRILVDKKFVKYITIDGGLYSPEDMCFEPTLVSIIPPLPTGNWNTGRISLNTETGQPHFSSCSTEILSEIKTDWHPRRVDYLALDDARKLRSNVYEVSCPGFDSPVVAKFARFGWEIPQLEAETLAYSWIEGHKIGPEFLGHITEQGRVIGFLMSNIPQCRHAGPEDFSQCRDALIKLHRLGIMHGDINKHNFLVSGGGVTLIDFDVAVQRATTEELDRELQALMGELEDSSGRGGVIVESDPVENDCAAARS
ncbi:hypothetical protein PWT90_04197 [Aphanocladium album]|nr:hypothetical protein PWT90_04197 [Aphanocladium album]